MFVGSLHGTERTPAVTAFAGAETANGAFARVLGSYKYTGLTGTSAMRLMVRDLTGDGLADLRFGSQPIDRTLPVAGNNSDRVSGHSMIGSNGTVYFVLRGYGSYGEPFADISSSLNGVEVG